MALFVLVFYYKFYLCCDSSIQVQYSSALETVFVSLARLILVASFIYLISRISIGDGFLAPRRPKKHLRRKRLHQWGFLGALRPVVKERSKTEKSWSKILDQKS